MKISRAVEYLIYSKCSDRVCPEKYPRDGYDELYMAIMGEDNVYYAVSEESLHADVDIWHDPRLDESIFMSAALKKALDKAKMSKVWKLVFLQADRTEVKHMAGYFCSFQWRL